MDAGLIMTRALLLMLVLSANLLAGTAWAERAKLVVGCSGAIPYCTVTPEGEFIGFVPDLIRRVAELADFDIEFRELPPGEMLRAQQAGAIQLLVGVPKLASLAESSLASLPVGRSRTRLFARAERADLLDGGPIRGQRLEYVDAGIGANFPEFIALNKAQPRDTLDQIILDLLAGRTDLALMSDTTMLILMREMQLEDRIIAGPAVEETPRVIYLHRSRADQMFWIDSAIASMEQTGELGRIRRKWQIEGPEVAPAVLTVGVGDFPPEQWVNTDGSAGGFAVDVFRDLARLAGLQYRFIPLEAGQYALGPVGNAVDLFVSYPISDYARAQMDFTLPIHSTPILVYVRAGDRGVTRLADLGEDRLGMTPTTAKFASDNGFLDLNRAEIGDELLLAEELLKGEIRGVLAPASFGSMLQSQRLDDKLVPLADPAYGWSEAVALRRGLSGIRERINNVLPGYLASADYQKLRERYFAVPLFWTEARVRILIMAGAASIVLLTLGFLSVILWRQRLNLRRERDRSRIIEALNVELERQVVNTNNANEELRVFAYATSHDLKAPTNTMRLLLSGLAEELTPDVDSETAEMLQDMNTTVTRMGILIEDVLGYTGAIGSDFACEEIALDHVLNGVLEDLRADIAASGAEIERRPLPRVTANPGQMRQLLQNLLSNALKFRTEGVRPRVTVSAAAAPAGMAAIRVCDNGIGIAPEYHGTIFRLFGRLHDREQFPGTGLGLAICQRIARNHGGGITVDSDVGRGSCFTVTMRKMPG